MPAFGFYNIIQKGSIGFDKIYQFITFKYNYPLIIVTFLVITYRLSNKHANFSNYMQLFVVASLIPLMIYHSLCGNLFFEGNIVDNGNASRMIIYVSYAYCIAYIISIFLLLLI